MEFKTYMGNLFNAETPNDPEKDIPLKPDKNPDQTRPKPGGNEPNKVDPTRIEQPQKTDPTRIGSSKTKIRAHKLTKVNSWEEALEKMKGVLEK